FKVGFHSPFVSYVEGILARGDERVSDLIQKAWEKGARLDAWDEYFKRDLWREIISGADWDIEKEICSPKDINAELPWDSVSLGVSKEQFKIEYERAMTSELTAACDNPCREYCGVCNKNEKVRYPEGLEYLDEEINIEEEKGQVRRILLNFKKKDSAIYFGHLNIMHMFEMAFQRASFNLFFTQGYNPKPKMEFPHPLTLGVASEGEVIGFEMYYHDEDMNLMIETLNKVLPQGIEVTDYLLLPVPEEGRKYKSLMAQYWGSLYTLKLEGNSPMTLDELFKELNEKVQEFDVREDYSFVLKKDSIEIVSEMKNKKMNNIIRLLGEILGENPMSKGVILRRIETYKKDKEEKSLFL
ncbi:MAG: DUF2344 domain-containing protein, partial [Spirochaetaceae bacterium]|nr:DUF2344 domain-containing protein [Spirochaetaceae bacterium]